jgi:hypothetical protein
MYEPLRAYFITQLKGLTLILIFSQNEISKFRFLCLHTNLDNFTKAIQRIERQSASDFEVANEFKDSCSRIYEQKTAEIRAH